MDTSTAISLIREGIDVSIRGQVWHDLGAGRGTFTTALAGLLDKGSIVNAVDKDEEALCRIRQVNDGAKISIVTADFTDSGFSIEPLNGVLMANALHFVEDQSGFLVAIRNRFLLPRGRLIVVEYDRRIPNPWVPFPVEFNQLKEISLCAGFAAIEKLGEVPSAYGHGLIYGALIKK